MDSVLFHQYQMFDIFNIRILLLLYNQDTQVGLEPFYHGRGVIRYVTGEHEATTLS
jgi:hypothetical protein